MRVPFLFGLLAAAVGAFAQSPTFEVASIRPSAAPTGDSSGIKTETGRIDAHNVTLRRCIRGAYNLPETLVVGGPKWIDDTRYDIVAKAPGRVGDHELMEMLQALLTERFHLEFHREKRPIAGYALVLAKGGLKAKPSDPETHSVTNVRRGGIDAQGITMADLSQKLTDALHLPVADFTAKEGRFDLQLQWTPEEKANKSGDSGISIFAALQEQAGLKLESRKVPVEVIVIDKAEKATEN